MREVLTKLYKLDKYDITLYAAGMPWEHPDFERWPWKVFGTLPNNQAEIEQLNRDPNLAREANYGGYYIDKLVKEVKPDIIFMSEDPWAFEGWRHKSWWGKVPCVVHTTLDSRPIYPAAIELAKATPYFYSWADFATQELHKLGQKHVKTLRGTVNSDVYRRLPEYERIQLREKHGIPKNAYCMGMLSRNQLRKSFPNIVRAYKEFKDKNPQIKETRLLFFTHYAEGWNIPALCQELGVNEAEVLATYKCRATGRYYIMPFKGIDIDNPETGHPKSLITPNTQDGLTDEQVNEWYNILDVYVHAFTSGGQERSIQEAKLAELITLVTNYSCGEDACVEEACSLPLDYDEYREPGTQFIKATTKPYSIVKQLEKVYKMDAAKKREYGQKAREWTLKNYAIEKIASELESLFDSMIPTNYDFTETVVLPNPTGIAPDNSDNKVWVKSLYKNILSRDVSDTDDGLLYWLKQLDNNSPKPQIEEYFRSVAREEINKLQGASLDKILGPEKPEDRILITMPESLGDCFYLTSLLEDARKLYPGKKIYVSTKPPYIDVFLPLKGNLIDYIIEWNPMFDNVPVLEGMAGHPKFFQIVLSAHAPSQRLINYRHNGSDVCSFKLCI